MKLPTLYKKTSKGTVQIWEVEVNDNVITTTHGQIDGKKQINSETISNGKNVGKKNETTPAQQAESEAQSEWTRKQERQNYTLDIASLDVKSDNGGAVMLAHKYSEHADKMALPCYISPKLDGNRCKAFTKDGVCTLYSRTGKVITGVPHINTYLARELDNCILDGELYNHEYRYKFEELTSFIRQDTPKEGHEIVQFHVYDLIGNSAYSGTDLTYSERLAWLDHNIDESDDSPLRRVESELVHEAEQLELKFRFHLSQGYEGSMARDPFSMYEHKRSYGLQKIKEMDDAEFMVIAIVEGKGKMAGKAKLTCQLPDESDTFDCSFKGTYEFRQHMYENPDAFIGKMLTVQHQGTTAYGKPRFPVGLRFRQDV